MPIKLYEDSVQVPTEPDAEIINFIESTIDTVIAGIAEKMPQANSHKVFNTMKRSFEEAGIFNNYNSLFNFTYLLNKLGAPCEELEDVLERIGTRPVAPDVLMEMFKDNFHSAERQLHVLFKRYLASFGRVHGRTPGVEALAAATNEAVLERTVVIQADGDRTTMMAAPDFGAALTADEPLETDPRDTLDEPADDEPLDREEPPAGTWLSRLLARFRSRKSQD